MGNWGEITPINGDMAPLEQTLTNKNIPQTVIYVMIWANKYNS